MSSRAPICKISKPANFGNKNLVPPKKVSISSFSEIHAGFHIDTKTLLAYFAARGRSFLANVGVRFKLVLFELLPDPYPILTRGHPTHRFSDAAESLARLFASVL